MPARLGDLTRAQLNHEYSLDYAKWLTCLAETGGLESSAAQMFCMRYPNDIGTSLLRKAAVAAGSTTDPAWAGALVGITPFEDAFISLARSASLLGRLPLRIVPFNMKVPVQTGGGTFAWVAQGFAKPVTALAFSDGVTLRPTKLAGLVPITKELLKSTVPGFEKELRDELIAELTAATDKSFLDPTQTGTPDKQPASVTAGTVPIASTGNYPVDLQSLLSAFFTGRPSAAAPVLITSAANAATIGSMNAGGGVGLPVIVSEAALGNTIVLDPRGILLADNGGKVDASGETTYQSNTTPDTPALPTSVFNSAWQNNEIVFRVERFVNWQSTTGAVKYLAGA